MKTITLLLLPIFGCVTAVLAETERPAPTTARVIGDLPDGTPPPPEPPKPAFIVASKDILDTQIHEQGGRKITVQKINPSALPPPPMAEPPLDKTDPAVQARLAAFRAKYPRNEFIRIGATVYHAQDSTTRTLVTY